MAISFVGAATGTTSATLPTHAADDVLIAFAHRDGNTTAPSLPAGWTDLGSGGANVNSSRIGYKVAASSSETSGTWTNATGLLVQVYRGCNTTDPIGDVVAGGSSSLVVAYPALTLQVTDGTSWVVAVAGHRSIDVVGLDSPPAGLTNRAYQQDATATIAGHDSAAGVSSFAGTSDTLTGTSGGWRSWSIELLAALAGGSITGDLAATESGSDTAAFVGDVIVSGDLAATESGSDTAVFTGFVEGEIVGSLAATESGSDTAAFSGDVIISGTLAATETGSDTAAFTGTVPLSTITGTLAAVESSDTASFSAPAIRSAFPQSGFELPSKTPVVDADGNTNRQWMQWLDRIHAIASATEQSGPTASRPTKRLWIGRTYFDTTLGYQVWVKSVNPVVWVNASGATV